MLRFLVLSFLIAICNLSVSNAQDLNAKQLLDSLMENLGNSSAEVQLNELFRLKTLSIEERDINSLAYSLLGLYNVHYDLKNYGQFESTLIEYLDLAKDTTKLDVFHYSTALSGFAVLSKIKGNYKRAIDFSLKSIELENKNGGNLNELNVLYNNISGDYRLLGDYENSLSIAYKAFKNAQILSISSKIDNNLILVSPILNIVHSLKNLNQLKEASQWINKGVNLVNNDKVILSEDYYDLAIDVYLRRAEVNLLLDSLQYVVKDLEKVISLQKKESYRRYYLFELYGEYYSKLGKHSISIDIYDSALEDAKKEYANNRLWPVLPRIFKRRAVNFTQLDSIEAAFVNFQDGLRYFDKSLDDDWSFNPSFKISSSAPVGLDLLNAKATYAKDLFKETSGTTYLTIAKKTYRAAMNLIDAMRLSYINEGSKYYIVTQAQSLYKDYIDLLVSAEKHFPKDEWAEEIYNTIQRNKNSVLIERIKEKVAVLSSNLPDDVKDKESKLRSDISFYTKLLSEVDKSDSTAFVSSKSHEENLFKAKEDYAILNNNLRSKYPEYYALTNTSKEYYSLVDVKKAVRSGEAIIEFFAMNSGYLTLTISDSEVQVNVLQDENISRLLIYYIADVSQSPVISGNSISDISIQSERIYTKLLGSINGLENIEHLYIIPDGLISKLPFSSLIDPKTKEYLLSEKSISYLLSVDQFINQEKTSSEKESVLGISPNFSTDDDVIDCQCNGNDLTDLSYAMDELTYLQSIYDGNYINESEATMASFIDNVKEFPIIHLATHACLNESDPMLSQIFFSDGSLTNYDLQNLNISPELVVLAACNTAQGEIQKGEGVISLSRGFFEAGVKSLVSSLWSIDDYSSSKIVKGMYTHLKDGKSKPQSLRQSKLDYLESADKLRSHPYYWAGLVQIGDGNPIIETRNWSMIIGLAALFFIALFLFLRKRK